MRKFTTVHSFYFGEVDWRLLSDASERRKESRANVKEQERCNLEVTPFFLLLSLHS